VPKRYPPLTPQEVRDILRAAGFALERVDGSHEQWESGSIRGRRRLVTVDAGVRECSMKLIRSMIEQSGLTRDEFYRQTARTAPKINLPPLR
jgi:predicted RNA binding protein YcfA (HicA-like mRNA interferase family)